MQIPGHGEGKSDISSDRLTGIQENILSLSIFMFSEMSTAGELPFQNVYCF